MVDKTIEQYDSEITIINPFFKKELIGRVVHYEHEIDGSQTILIRTKRRKSVDEFIQNDMTDYISITTKLFLNNFLSASGKKLKNTIEFEAQEEQFSSLKLCENYCELIKYTVGQIESCFTPIALSRNGSKFPKWQHINLDEWKLIDGLIVSDNLRDDCAKLYILE